MAFDTVITLKGIGMEWETVEFDNDWLIIPEGFFRAFFNEKVHTVNFSAFTRLNIHRGVILRHSQTKQTLPLSPSDGDSSSSMLTTF